MAIPEGALIDEELEIEEQPNYTYKIDFKTKRISGMIDQLEAIKQAIFKILQTERFEHLIYSEDYGFESLGLVGQPRAYIQSELSRRITEALLQDDRITDISDFEFKFGDDDVLVKFTAVTDYGDITETVEVNNVV